MSKVKTKVWRSRDQPVPQLQITVDGQEVGYMRVGI